MDLVQIDCLYLEPAKTAFGEYIGTRSAPAFQCSRNNLLGVTHAINGRGIDPVNAKLQCAVYCSDGSLVVLIPPAKLPACAADGPGTEAHWCNKQVRVSKSFHFHIDVSKWCCCCMPNTLCNGGIAATARPLYLLLTRKGERAVTR